VKVLLASSPHGDTFGYSMPPPGLLRLGGELRQAGWDVALDDLAYRVGAGQVDSGEDLCASAARWLLARGACEVLGLSTMGATLPAAVAIARHYKRERPNTRVLIGGPGTTGTDRALLERFAWIDGVVRGEGEATLHEWLQRGPGDGHGIAGMTWRNAQGAVVREPDRAPRRDLERVADYAWDLLPPLTDYKALTGEPEGLVPLDSGRGCAYDCSFCTIGRYWQRRSRPLPAERLAQEILSLQTMPGAGQAYLCHDIFGADRAHALELCERLIAAGSPVPFEVRARVDHLDGDLLAAMAQAGCYRVLLGIESGSSAIRERHQKNLRGEVDVLAVVDRCEAVGIVPILSLILGLPGEGPEELAASLDLCAQASLRRGVHISLHLVNPQPGCGLGEEFGADSQAVEGIPPDMALGAGQSPEERALISAHPDLFCSFHLLPAQLFPGGKADLLALSAMAKGLPELWRRYPRTFALLGRQHGENAYQVWQRLLAAGTSFAGLVRRQRDERLDACLAWEQASIRCASRMAPHAVAEPADWLPRPAGEVLRSRFDLAALARSLRVGTSLPEPGGVEAFAVVPGPGHLGSVRTLRISRDTEQLLDWLGQKPRPRQEAPPALLRALDPLHRAGLLASQPTP